MALSAVSHALIPALRNDYNGAMPYTPILATLGYLLSADGRQVLLVHRNLRPDDPHFGKYNGLGGKLDRGGRVAHAGCSSTVSGGVSAASGAGCV